MLPPAEQVFSILTVRSASSTTTAEDLTTRARIRDAAIVAFGRQGFAAMTVRGIAAEVGVSPALVLHHFGSKDGLRRACDEFITDFANDKIDQLAADDSPATVIGMLDRTEEYAPIGLYLRRAMLDGGEFAERMFAAVVADTKRYLTFETANGKIVPSDDDDNRAVALVVFSLGLQLLARLIAPPGTPDEQLGQQLIDRLGLPILELYTNGLYTSSELLDAYRARTPHPTSPPENESP